MIRSIAHRGLLAGNNIDEENSPAQVDWVISQGFDSEVDIWFLKNNFYLGHDIPQHIVSQQWLSEKKKHLWLHCKNIEALDLLLNLDNNYNFFWHENDDHTLTSKGFIWTYPGKSTTKFSVLVAKTPQEHIELVNTKEIKLYGLCSRFFISS